MEEDNTVHSAYNIAGRGLRSSHTGSGSSEAKDCVYDDGLDVGYRIKTLNNLDSSRIELAGGREKISQSLLRTAKKKHNDETVRHNPHSGTKMSQKRFNGDALYDEEMKEYKSRSWNQHQPTVTKSHKSFRNFAYQNEAPRHRAPCRISPTSPLEEYCQDSDPGNDKRQNKYMYEAPHSRSDDLSNRMTKVGTHLISESPSDNVICGELQVDVDNEMHVSSSGGSTSNSSQQPSPVGRITRLIGNLPIAEYDGSPRRYGPRPGFPLRVSEVEDKLGHSLSENDGSEQIQSIKNSDSDVQSKTINDLCDKVNGEVIAESLHIADDGLDVCKNGVAERVGLGPGYSELEYKLYRLNADNYIGKRLAQSVSTSESNDSPKKADPKNDDHQYAESNPDYG